MIAKFVWMVVGLALLLCASFGIASVDWYAYRPAQAPDHPEEIDATLAQLGTLRIGDFNALERLVSLEWSQYVPVTVTAQCAADTFQENRKAGDGFSKKQRGATTSEKLTASIFVRIERKSSLNGGIACVSMCGSGAKIDQKHVLSWAGRLQIPRVPGDYLGKVVLVCQKHPQPRVTETDEVLIGTFPLKVVPCVQR